MTVLVAKKVTKRFGGLVAVKDLDITIEKGSIHSVIGPNGAGKTTFFNCITGFYIPEEGDVRFLDEPIRGLRPDQIAKMGIGRTYQNIRLFSNITAIENVIVGMHSHLGSGVFDERGFLFCGCCYGCCYGCGDFVCLIHGRVPSPYPGWVFLSSSSPRALQSARVS